MGYKFGGGGGVGGPVAGWADAERAALSSPERPPPRVTPDELLSIADDVVARARPDEELEAVVSWSHDTEIRAADGEVEHFVESDSAGVREASAENQRARKLRERWGGPVFARIGCWVLGADGRSIVIYILRVVRQVC